VLRGLWDELPATHSLMQPAGSPKKYDQLPNAPSTEQLRAHLRGEITLAAPLVGVDGLARALVIDVDTGGLVAVERLLASATARGLTAHVVALDSGEHDGGHLWCRFDQAAEPVRLHTLAVQLIADAGLPPETERWPTGPRHDIRLPFGLHRHCQRRGVLLLPDGRRFDLDTSEGLFGGLDAVYHQPLNECAQLPDPAPEAAPAAPATRRPGGLAGDSPIARLNAEATPEALAELLVQHFGCRVARHVPSGIMLHCGCGHHANGDTKASVRVYEGRNGKVLVSSYSPGCHWRQRAATDYAAVYVAAHRLSYADLAPQRPARRGPAAPTERDRRQSDPDARARDAAHKRDTRQEEARAIMADVRDRAAIDPVLVRRPTERDVLRVLSELAGHRAWCRPSKERLVDLSGWSLGAVKRALIELERRGYFASQGQGGSSQHTAVRTFLRGSPPCEPMLSRVDASTGIRVIHESIEESVLVSYSEAGEGGQGDAAHSADPWETWEWADAPHGAHELEEPGIVALPPSPAPRRAPADAQPYDLRAWLRLCLDAPVPPLSGEPTSPVPPDAAPAPESRQESAEAWMERKRRAGAFDGRGDSGMENVKRAARQMAARVPPPDTSTEPAQALLLTPELAELAAVLLAATQPQADQKLLTTPCPPVREPEAMTFDSNDLIDNDLADPGAQAAWREPEAVTFEGGASFDPAAAALPQGPEVSNWAWLCQHWERISPPAAAAPRSKRRDKLPLNAGVSARVRAPTELPARVGSARRRRAPPSPAPATAQANPPPRALKAVSAD